MKQTYVMLLWHMHQPFYKDLAEGVYAMPCVRLHALKDYYGMVAMLQEFPAFHATFNLVPSLVSQLQEYARDEVREQAFDLTFKPAVALSPVEREKLIEFSFQMNVRNLVNRFPRLRELYGKVHSGNSGTFKSCVSLPGLMRSFCHLMKRFVISSIKGGDLPRKISSQCAVKRLEYLMYYLKSTGMLLGVARLEFLPHLFITSSCLCSAIPASSSNLIREFGCRIALTGIPKTPLIS